MTWVIGRAGPFGYAVGLSDIRITLSDGTELDCLQKIYKIGNQMVLGFAGSVAIGMEVVTQLSEGLHLATSDGVWDPRYVATMLPIGTRELFNSFDDQEKELGCGLLLLGAHPKENDGAAPWAKCFAYRFRAPEFRPMVSNGAEIVSIGSGSNVNQYADALGKLSNDYEMFNLETGFTGGAGLGLMMSVSSVLNNLSVPGISPHLHICVVGRDSVKLGTNNRDVPDRPDINFVMPTVATNMDELRKIIAGSSSLAIKGASC